MFVMLGTKIMFETRQNASMLNKSSKSKLNSSHTPEIIYKVGKHDPKKGDCWPSLEKSKNHEQFNRCKVNNYVYPAYFLKITLIYLHA